MKTVKDLKVGDTAYDVLLGEVTVVRIDKTDKTDNYPIKVKDKQEGFIRSYTFEGKIWISHQNPSLYLSNPFEQKGKWMMVCDDNLSWIKRFVIAEKNGRFVAWTGAETDEKLLTATDNSVWKYAKEIEEETIPEYTMEELVAKLGNFKIKK